MAQLQASLTATRNAHLLTRTAEQDASNHCIMLQMKSEVLAPKRTIPIARPPIFSLKKILVGIDFSPASKQAFTYAIQLARQFRASVILLHVLEPAALTAFAGFAEPPARSKTDTAEAEASFRALAAEIGSEERKGIRWEVRNGLATHEIVAAAQDADVDLVVVGTHGFTSGKHFCIGATAERVARAAPCAVLVVREKEYEL